LGGVLFPQDQLPGVLQAVGNLLPTAALSEVLRDTLMSSGESTSSWLVLAAWAVAAPAAAAKFFRWS
jgi:ABC-2 type transport system permease protein